MKPVVVELYDMKSVVALLKHSQDMSDVMYILCVSKMISEDQSDFVKNLGEILEVELTSNGHTVIKCFDLGTIDDSWFKLTKLCIKNRIGDPCAYCRSLRHAAHLPIMNGYNTPFLLTGDSNPIIDDDRFRFITPLIGMDNDKIENEYIIFCSKYGIKPDLSLFTQCVFRNSFNSIGKNDEINQLILDELEVFINNADKEDLR